MLKLGTINDDTAEGQQVESGGQSRIPATRYDNHCQRKEFRDLHWTSGRLDVSESLASQSIASGVLIGHAKRNAGSVDAVLARSSGRPRTRLDRASRATTACLSRPGDRGRLIAEPTRVPGHLGSFNPARQVAEDGDETPSENPQPQKGSPLTCSQLRTHGAGRLLAESPFKVPRSPATDRASGLQVTATATDNRVEGGERRATGGSAG